MYDDKKKKKSSGKNKTVTIKSTKKAGTLKFKAGGVTGGPEKKGHKMKSKGYKGYKSVDPRSAMEKHKQSNTRMMNVGGVVNMNDLKASNKKRRESPRGY